jgi:hypothetical protein
MQLIIRNVKRKIKGVHNYCNFAFYCYNVYFTTTLNITSTGSNLNADYHTAGQA